MARRKAAWKAKFTGFTTVLRMLISAEEGISHGNGPEPYLGRLNLELSCDPTRSVFMLATPRELRSYAERLNKLADRVEDLNKGV